jgi:predicted N-acetyltransferase YhbS
MAAVLDSVRALFAPASTFTIDAETPADVVARETLLDRTMGADRRLKSSEKIRRNRVPAEGLALVARDRDGHVIGTVRLWNIEAGISPEGKGIGGALMRAAVAEAHRRSHGAVLLVGDAAYYERFGFFAGKTAHLVMPGPFQRDRFLALELKAGWLEGAAGMIVASGRKLA